jgi:hypothetical protein
MQQLLERQQKELRKLITLKSNKKKQRAKACLKLDKLMKDVYDNQLSTETTCVKNKSHKIEIRLFTEYSTSGGGH